MKRCRTHGDIFSIGDYCPECGEKLEEYWRYVCLSCGHKTNFTDKFCVYCGSQIIIDNEDEIDR